MLYILWPNNLWSKLKVAFYTKMAARSDGRERQREKEVVVRRGLLFSWYAENKSENYDCLFSFNFLRLLCRYGGCLVQIRGDA